MTFAYPLALLVPLLFAAIAIRRPKVSGIPYPSRSVLEHVPPSLLLRLRRPILLLVGASAIICASIAAARPQRVTIFDDEDEAHNLVLALDVSRSMAAQDFPAGFTTVDRLSAVKQVVSQFIRERRQERVGLVVFGNGAFVQAPLTRDLELVGQLVDALQVGVAGDGTALGDGLGLSVKMLDSVPGKTKAVILLTDGVNTAGKVNPLQAAAVARDLGIKVHSVGIGASGEDEGLMAGIFALQGGMQQEFDEKTLRAVAETTGGVYFHASNIKMLKSVYDSIDELQKSRDRSPPHRIVEELFPPFAQLAGLLTLLLVILTRTSLRRLSA